MKCTPILLVFPLLGCQVGVEYLHDRRGCPTAGGSGSEGGGSDSGGTTDASGAGSGSGGSDSAAGTTTSAGSSGGESGGSSGSASSSSDSSGGGSDSSGGADSGDPPAEGPPTPTGECPEITDGVVSFCPAGYECRDALVINAAGASEGPLALHFHGTYESPDGVIATDWAAQQIQTMVQTEGGLMVLPYADPEAVARPDNPFPWWVVCGEWPSQCDREDDFAFADEIVACAVEQGLVDPNRLNVSGMSAGGIMTSHLVDRTTYFAAAVSWSGGLPGPFQPATPSNDTAVMVVHGGANDLYCGTGVTTCTEFWPQSETFAQDVAAAGNFAFLCDHQSGHTPGMGNTGAAFLAASNIQGHSWAGYPFGSGGSWMLDNYCYAPGDPSPWQ